MRERKDVVHELFELRSKLFFVKDEIERRKLNESINKIKKELIEISLEDAKSNYKRGR